MISISAQDNVHSIILNLITFYIIDNYYDGKLSNYLLINYLK